MFRTVRAKLDEILIALARIETRLFTNHEETMADITALTAAVAQETTLQASVLTLLQGLQSQVANLQPTQAAIDALATQMQSNISALAAAVPANVTPAPAPAAPATPAS